LKPPLLVAGTLLLVAGGSAAVGATAAVEAAGAADICSVVPLSPLPPHPLLEQEVLLRRLRLRLRRLPLSLLSVPMLAEETGLMMGGVSMTLLAEGTGQMMPLLAEGTGLVMGGVSMTTASAPPAGGGGPAGGRRRGRGRGRGRRGGGPAGCRGGGDFAFASDGLEGRGLGRRSSTPDELEGIGSGFAPDELESSDVGLLLAFRYANRYIGVGGGGPAAAGFGRRSSTPDELEGIGGGFAPDELESSDVGLLLAFRYAIRYIGVGGGGPAAVGFGCGSPAVGFGLAICHNGACLFAFATFG
jgi:hypothetical protein